MNGSFYEQLGSMCGVFEQWGGCERTVVACVLARRVPWPGLRLLQRAVDAALRARSLEDERLASSLEHDANDEAYLAPLLAPRSDDDDDDGDKRLQKLVTLVPLLHSENSRVKEAYVGAAPALVQRAVDAASPAAPALARELLSYLLVHPALSPADQRTLTQWLRYLENHISGNRNTETVWQQRIDPCLVPEANIWSNPNPFRRTIGKNVEFRTLIDSVDHFTADLLQESFSKNGRDVDISIDSEKVNFDAAISQPKSQRSNSLTPPTTNFLQMSSSAENLSDEPFVQKPRSFSLSSEHSLAQLRPLSILYGTTGSETRLDDLRSNNFTEHPGMSTVAQWLKSLRLHKYVWLFTNISYEQMVAMDDKYLEKLGVTKGARHKILLSIKKLSERGAILEACEKELARGTSSAGVGRVLSRLRLAMLAPTARGDPLPYAVVRVLQLASKCLSGGGPGSAPRSAPEDADHDAPDPLSLHCWLVEKALHHESFNQPELIESLKRLRHRLPPRQFYRHVGDMPPPHRKHSVVPRWRVSAAWRRTPAAPPAGRSKSHSYPPGAPPPAPPSLAPSALALAPAPCLDYSRLDALCLQMTEHAID